MPIYTPGSDSQSESSKMKIIYFSNEFPHDLQGLFRQLHNYSKDRRYPVLASFLDEATLALRDEVRQLPTSLRTLIPPFETILNFVDYEELQKGPLSGSIEGVLLCVVELSALIGYQENFHAKNDFDNENLSVTGLGIGLLASAAVAISPALTDIPLAGAEAVRIAFRLGVHVDEVSHNMEVRDFTGPQKAWAYVVPHAKVEDVQNELDSAHTMTKAPETSRIFISAVSETSVTISGPPSRLEALFRNSEFLRGCKPIALPVYGGLCHAEHIYNQNNVHAIVQSGALDMLPSKFAPRIPIYSTGTGRPYMAKSAKDLFEQIVSELLTQQIHWTKVVQGIVESAQNVTPSECHILVFRNSLPVRELLEALKFDLPDLDVITEDILPWLTQKITGEGTRRKMQSKIAIVGMACRMPSGATDTEEFWNLLERGLDVHKRIPADRFDVDTHSDSTGKRVNTSHTAYGCFIDQPGLFDAAFFNMSPREAEQTDPMQRLALVTAYEALEKAGYVANRTAATNLHRIGTFYGQASDDYREVNTAQNISTYFIPGGCRAFGPGRINYFFKFSGPSFSCDTACSSSLATIQAACTSLWSGDTDTVVAGGMNVLTNSDAFAGLSHGHFLTKTPNACKTWDSEADGYCRADGIGSIVMKRLEDAEADNDNILGVILGAATNHSAEAVSITHPHAGAQSYLYRQVLSRAGLDPFDVSFIEMHGTGTQAGDSVEIKSITDVFAPIKKPRTSKQPLYIGAVKSNVGHGEAAAGVTALLKVLLMFQKSAIPPHVGIKNSINPGFPKDFDRRNLHIPYEKTPWLHTSGKKRIAIVNNFSAAGGNTTLAMEEPPIREQQGESDPRSMHVIAVSAKSKVSMKGNIERLIAYLDANPDISLSNLSYSTTARRYHHNHRLAIPTTGSTQLRKQLATYLGKVDTHKPISTSGPPPIAFAFTGQGASYRSMNLELFHSCPYFQSQVMHLDSLAQKQGFPTFIPAIDGSCNRDFQHSPVVTQLSLVCTEIALAKYWESLGVKPSVVVGHSLGEYAALHIAGVLSASDTIFLAGHRAQLLQERCQIGGYKMMAVRCSVAELEKCGGGLPYEVACINGPKDTVISGTQEQIDALFEALGAKGHKCICLEVAFAFHSEQTDPILDDFEELAKGVVFQAPNLPVISPLLSKVIFDDDTLNAKYMRRVTREPVNFLSGIEMAQKLSIIDESTIWVEIGPHPVCMNFIKSTLPFINIALPSFRRDENNWTTIAQSLSAMHCTGVAVSWSEFHRSFEAGLRLLDLPTYYWNDKNYWIMYNGDWALTKGNTFYDAEKAAIAAPTALVSKSGLTTSTVHQIIAENFNGTEGNVVMQADLMQSDFFNAAYGHKMNGCGVVTSSIHADIAYTLGEYLYKKLRPRAKQVDMNFANLEVVKGLVAKKDRTTPQLIQVSAETVDLCSVSLKWYNFHSDGTIDEPFASASLFYGDATEWLTSWVPVTHLVQGRIQDLEHQAEAGTANKFSHNYAYLLFATNLVDYDTKYRGMQSVILQGFEAVADIVLSKEKGGTWTIPPYFIDSVAHLARFIMNVSDNIDAKADFCVTPGFRSMRFGRPLVAGSRYRSYVKMIPTPEDPTVYLGDVYILQDGIIIGMVEAMQFRRYPRILLNRFFSAPDDLTYTEPTKSGAITAMAPTKTAQKPTKAVAAPVAAIQMVPVSIPPPAKAASNEVTTSAIAPPNPKVHDPLRHLDGAIIPNGSSPDLVSVKALMLIAEQTGLQLGDLDDEASFSALGVDSLMSLVIAEKFREELGIAVGGGLFLEYPTIGDLRLWLEDYYN